MERTYNKQHIKLFWMIARLIDQYPKDAGYIDERLYHRVQNLCRGLNLLGREPERTVVDE